MLLRCFVWCTIANRYTNCDSNTGVTTEQIVRNTCDAVWFFCLLLLLWRVHVYSLFMFCHCVWSMVLVVCLTKYDKDWKATKESGKTSSKESHLSQSNQMTSTQGSILRFVLAAACTQTQWCKTQNHIKNIKKKKEYKWWRCLNGNKRLNYSMCWREIKSSNCNRVWLVIL